MSALLSDLLNTGREHALGIALLPAARRDQVRSRVTSRYGSGRVWERADGSTSVQSVDGWMWIGPFVGARPCILLFDTDEEPEMIHIPSGPALDALLRDSCFFEFYVTDEEATYLICFNHHDVLVCWGSARAWLASRRLDSV